MIKAQQVSIPDISFPAEDAAGPGSPTTIHSITYSGEKTAAGCTVNRVVSSLSSTHLISENEISPLAYQRQAMRIWEESSWAAS